MFVNIIKSSSTKGLSETSLYLETIGLEFMFVFHIFAGTSVSLYGDAVSIFVQNLILLGMVWHLNGGGVAKLAGALLFFSLLSGALVVTPPEFRYLFLIGNSVCILANRLPQIMQNFSQGHTGVLSVITEGLKCAGITVRCVLALSRGSSSMRVRFLKTKIGRNSLELMSLQVADALEGERRRASARRRCARNGAELHHAWTSPVLLERHETRHERRREQKERRKRRFVQIPGRKRSNRAEKPQEAKVAERVKLIEIA